MVPQMRPLFTKPEALTGFSHPAVRLAAYFYFYYRMDMDLLAELPFMAPQFLDFLTSGPQILPPQPPEHCDHTCVSPSSAWIFKLFGWFKWHPWICFPMWQNLIPPNILHVLGQLNPHHHWVSIPNSNTYHKTSNHHTLGLLPMPLPLEESSSRSDKAPRIHEPMSTKHPTLSPQPSPLLTWP